MQKILATEQAALGNGNGADVVGDFVPLGDGIRNGFLTLVAEDTPNMTVVIESPDANGKTIPIHTEVITGATAKSIYLGDYPFSRIRTRCSDYVSGNYSSALHSF